MEWEMNRTSGLSNEMNLVPVTEIPSRYQSVFQSFPYFNIVQSTIFQDAFYTDKSLIVCAPTGSGKTVIFELCIIRLLLILSEESHNLSKFKIVYMAPVKSLCNERYEDWKSKFEPLGISCIQLTGDSETEDYFELQKHSLILTTPEKWDSMTRLWKNNKVLVQMVKLLLIDEVAEWLSTPSIKGVFYKCNENLRPVSLRKIVIGYPYNPGSSEFKFDLMLSYKLNYVIQTYSEYKPTLVFCSTRKSVIQTASTLSKTAKFVSNSTHKVLLIDAANRIHDATLRDCILNGIGFHHGGLDVSDRRLLENMFLSCQLLVLVSTSTLSMGVNFPAHLVVIKSTSQYIAGCYKEYTNIQMFQMIGRAGRPQFDKSATAVIMTKSNLQAKYESLINGTQLIESNLHKHMAEHLNAEIALHSITDVSIAMEWLKATYLYQRVFKNPNYYGMNADLPKDKIERKLQDLCLKELNGLRKYELIFMDEDAFYLKPTQTGQLMAKYYISYETMKQFHSLTGNENLAEMIAVFSSCKEFDDIQLRVNEKKSLNYLNKNEMNSIRFPLQGKIKTKQMKINCLIQATFGCLVISDPSLSQDVGRIFKNSLRLSRCLVDYLATNKKGFAALHSAVILSKCFKARLWENSKFVSRQLEKIGVTFSNLLVNAGITTIENILKTNPRQIELILKRHPPFGDIIIKSAQKIPKYTLQVEQNLPFSNKTASISVTIMLENADDVLEEKSKNNHDCYILVGDADNKIIMFEKIRNIIFLDRFWTKKLDFMRSDKGDEINIHVISDTFVGIDIHQSYSVIYKSLDVPQNLKNTIQKLDEENPKVKIRAKDIHQMSHLKKRDCNHKCGNKDTCSHSCCKIGVVIPKKSQISKFMEQLQNKASESPKKVKIPVGTFSENIKMLKINHCNSISRNNLIPEEISKNYSMSLEDIGLTESGSNDHTFRCNMQKEELNMPFVEENNLECLNFDVNFETGHFDEKLLSENKEILPTERYHIFPHLGCTQKIEKWDDPKAAEETFNMCLNILSNNF